MVKVKDDSVSSNSWGEKYRVRKLEDFVGNEDTVSGIEAFIEEDRPPQAILITGPTGVGKTTLAQIIAKRLNGVPTFKKSLAKDINCGKDGGVNDARALIDASKFLPTLKYNIIILDEAHLLTRQAVSALLKELENPSKNVWILCTNEPQTLLDTMLGRCTVFRLEYPDISSGIRLLAKVCKKENVFVPPKKYKKLLKYIYEAANGDPRTMLNGLNGLALRYSKSKKEITSDMVMSVIQGTSSSEKGADQIVDLILKGEPNTMASLVNGYYYRMDFKFTSEILKRLVWAQQNAARGQKIKLYKEDETVNLPYKIISSIMKRLGDAAKNLNGLPSIVTAPIVYSTCLDCAFIVKNYVKEKD